MKWFLRILISVLALLFIARLVGGYLHEPRYFGRSDFAVFYTTAQFGFAGEDIYGNQDLYKTVESNRQAIGSVRYLYAPVVLFIFLPFTFFAFATAAWVWFGFNLLLLGCTILLLQKLLHTHFTARDFAVIVGLTAIFSPLFFSLRAGQVDVLLAAVLLLHLLCIKKARVVLSSILLGALIVIKIYPVIILLYYLLTRKFRVMLYSTASALAIFCLSIPILGWQQNADYLTHIPTLATSGIHQEGVSRLDNPTLNGLLYRVSLVHRGFGNHDAAYFAKLFQKTEVNYKNAEVRLNTWLHLAAVIPLFVFMVFVTVRRKKHSTDLIGVSLWLSFVFIAAKDAHSHYFVLLLPMILLLLLRPPTWFPRWPKPSYTFIAGVLCLAFSYTQAWPFIHMPNVVTILPFALVGNILLFFSVSYHYIRRPL